MSKKKVFFDNCLWGGEKKKKKKRRSKASKGGEEGQEGKLFSLRCQEKEQNFLLREKKKFRLLAGKTKGGGRMAGLQVTISASCAPKGKEITVSSLPRKKKRK